MKQLISTLAFCLGLSYVNAQHLKEADVPSTVKEAFAKKYPGSKVETWEKEGASAYEAEFDLNKVESSAVFDTNGAFMEFEQEIKVTELPKAAVDYYTKTFPDYKLSEAAKVTDATGKVTYEAEMKGKDHFDLYFDEKGMFLRKSK